jgi:hypothetical protein
MFFLKREDISQQPLRWEITDKHPRVLKKHLLLLYRYDSMFIEDLVMWRHYSVILENSDITILLQYVRFCIID